MLLHRDAFRDHVRHLIVFHRPVIRRAIPKTSTTSTSRILKPKLLNHLQLHKYICFVGCKIYKVVSCRKLAGLYFQGIVS